MIVDPNKLKPDLKEALLLEIAAILKIKPDQLSLMGLIIQLHNSAYNLEQMEKQLLLQAYVNASGSISKTASLLGVTRKTVYNLLKKHQIDSIINING